jgi:FeS assembly SUF system protein
VGIFSFLTGKQDDKRTAGEGEAKASPAPVQPPAPAPTSTSARAAEAPDPAPVPNYADTPFTPPEAWNLDALMAPPPEPTGEKPDMGPVDAGVTADLQPKIVEVLKTVYDPEIPVDIYELGLIYEILADANRRVLVRMTLTSPACPSAQQLPSEVRYKVKAIPGVSDAWVEIVWEPPWDKDRMSEAAKLQLGFF